MRPRTDLRVTRNQQVSMQTLACRVHRRDEGGTIAQVGGHPTRRASMRLEATGDQVRIRVGRYFQYE